MANPRYIIVGRSRDADVRLSDGSVSGRHARLSWRGTRILVEDLGSANGTFVRGHRVGRAEVRPGDDVRLGQAVLRWSDSRMRPFLRGGASDTVLGTPIPGRRFVCGNCGARGLMPPLAAAATVKCRTCGAHLVLGKRRRRWGAAALVTALAGVLVTGGTWSLAEPETADPVGVVAELFGLAPTSPPRSASPQEASVQRHTAPKVVVAVDSEHPITRNRAVQVAAEEEGPFRLEQVASVWTHVRGRWRYVNDPRGGEYFANASETIANDYAGDCDDFAIVVSAMIEAIGGSTRLVMMDGPAGGHAYAEVCVPGTPGDTAQRLARHYRRTWDRYLGRQAIEKIHFRSSPECEVWLNLDWNAGVPGGTYGQEVWAVAIYPDGRTETLAPATGEILNPFPSGSGAGASAPPLLR